MKKLLFIASLCLLVAGCSTMTPGRYAISVDNNILLKKYRGNEVVLASLPSSGEYDANCRLMGPIEAGDNLTIPQFIQKAFNDEFKFAEIYGTEGTQLTGSVDVIDFSSTSGWWKLGVTLRSPNGNSVSQNVHYVFTTSFDAITACNETARALGSAVQDLINRVAADPKFGDLLK